MNELYRYCIAFYRIPQPFHKFRIGPKIDQTFAPHPLPQTRNPGSALVMYHDDKGLIYIKYSKIYSLLINEYSGSITRIVADCVFFSKR